MITFQESHISSIRDYVTQELEVYLKLHTSDRDQSLGFEYLPDLVSHIVLPIVASLCALPLYDILKGRIYGTISRAQAYRLCRTVIGTELVGSETLDEECLTELRKELIPLGITEAKIQKIYSKIRDKLIPQVPTPLQGTIEVFFSYAHDDEDLRNKLAKHLHLMVRQGIIAGWHDRKIPAGTEWNSAIEQHVATAQIILLLISPDFIASDYCYYIEMQQAMARHEAGEACVIPIILRAVDWQSSLFGKLQALPKNGRPVTSWPNIDEAFTDVARGIRALVEVLTKPSSGRAKGAHR